MILRTKVDHGQLKSRLTKCRPMVSLIEQEIAAGSGDIEYVSENWVPMWVDMGNSVTSDCGRLRAIRAIGLDGTLMWFVQHPQKTFGYHSTLNDPFDAFDQANEAWRRRREVRSEWKHVEQLATDLLIGRKRFSVTRADAHASPLCTVGIDGFMASIGMANVQKISGRTAAILMKLDPQLGFVIREAYRRHAREERATARGKRLKPANVTV